MWSYRFQGTFHTFQTQKRWTATCQEWKLFLAWYKFWLFAWGCASWLLGTLRRPNHSSEKDWTRSEMNQRVPGVLSTIFFFKLRLFLLSGIYINMYFYNAWKSHVIWAYILFSKSVVDSCWEGFTFSFLLYFQQHTCFPVSSVSRL